MASFFFFLLLFLVFISSSHSLPYDAIALLSFKKTLTDHMQHLNDWSLSSYGAPCSWTGVICNNQSSAVVSLDISGKNLSGTLSPEISKLKGSLERLSVAENNLTGEIPEQVTELSKLTYLNLSNNLLSGGIPRNVSRMVAMEVLDAFNNNMTGELPVEVSLLTQLKHLHLGGNYFEGGIPPQYGNLVGLRYLALSGNALTGRIPPQLGNLINLERLYLGYYNQFHGGIPVELGRLTNLIRLDIANSGLTGPIPSALGSLINLDSLFLQTNSLFGSIPPELGNLTKLKSLDLSNNKLTGEIPLQLANLHSLELLNLFLNSFHGALPSFVADLPNLQVLTLWQNNFSGSIPYSLGMNASLMELDLSSNSFTGPIPPYLCRRNSLRRLILLKNRFTGSIPWSLASCWSLYRARLGQNLLSGNIPPSILALPYLDLLELSYNNLSGSFPSSPIPFSSRLGSLDLSHNLISGSIPHTIHNLSQLVSLDLSHNLLSGPIPAEIGSLPHLAKLDLSTNLITGSLPLSISKCSSLASLDLSHNRIHGEIPPQLSDLNVLASLNLSRNQFFGSIPLSLQNMVTLTTVDFSFNNLSGIIPDEGQFADFNQSSFFGNPHLCGKQMQLDGCKTNAGDHRSTTASSQSRSRSLIYGMSGLVVGLFAVTVAAVVFVFRNERDKQFLWSLFKESFLDKRWKLTAFERLDFTANDVLECLTDENVIGKGGSGTVYKGMMPNGKMVAIKRLPPILKGSMEDDDHGFSAEILTLGNIRHRHIVRLLGCCSNHETNLLLYEYMPNGSLGELLHGPRGGSLSWVSRYSIALEAAKGLCYLHHDCTPVIVHRDVKSNNILLDSNFEAHMADFGLARALPDSGKSQSMSSVAGSYGYIAPEYAYTLKINEKSDIYSFGVVLLELITGRRPIEPEYGDCIDIALWVRKRINSKEEIMQILDARMGLTEGSKQMQEVVLLLKIALRCLAEMPEQRPTMRDVVQLLSDIANSKESSSISSSQSMDPPDLISI